MCRKDFTCLIKRKRSFSAQGELGFGSNQTWKHTPQTFCSFEGWDRELHNKNVSFITSHLFQSIIWVHLSWHKRKRERERGWQHVERPWNSRRFVTRECKNWKKAPNSTSSTVTFIWLLHKSSPGFPPLLLLVLLSLGNKQVGREQFRYK